MSVPLRSTTFGFESDSFGDTVTKDGVWVNVFCTDDYACVHCAKRGMLKDDYERVVSISLNPTPSLRPSVGVNCKKE